MSGKKTISNTEQKIGNLRIQSSSQGEPIALVYGETRVPSNLLWYGDFTAVPHTTSQSGGKGGGVTQENTTFTYTTGIIFGLCEGPIYGVGTVWKNKDVTTTGNLGLTVFEGNYPQSPWSYLTTNHANEALGYLGTAYVASAALDLGGSSSTPNLNFEVRGFLFTGCSDVLPGAVLEDVLTAEHYGAGFPSAKLGDWSDFDDYCIAAGFRVAPAYTAQRSAADIVSELARIGNSGIVWSEGLLKLVPYAEEAVTGNATTGDVSASNATTVALFNFEGNLDDETSFSHDISSAGSGAGLSGGEIYFDGSGAGSYANTALFSTLALESEWTIQGYVTIPASTQPNSYPTIFVLQDAYPYSAYVMLRFDRESHLGQWELTTSAGGGGQFVYSTGTWPPGKYHFAVMNIASAVALWINGERVTAYINSDIPESTSDPLQLIFGNQFDSAGTPTSGSSFLGTLSSFKVTSDTALFDDSFTPPSEPLLLDGSEETISCVPAGEVTFTPDLTVQYDLTYSDFLASAGTDPIKVTRKRQADAYNMVQVECLDRDADYAVSIVEAKDQTNIDLYGLRPMEVVQCHAICDLDVARRFAQILLQRSLYQRNTYEFTVGWRYARLEPMDIVSLTDPKLGMDEHPVRITAIEESEDGELSMTAEDLLVGVSNSGNSSAYTAQASSGYITNNGGDPGSSYPPAIFVPPVSVGEQTKLYIGAAGGDNWGGAQVWVSSDNATYQQAGTLAGPARYGSLTANFPVGSDPDETNTLSVIVYQGSFDGVAASAADAQGTLSYIGPQESCELIAYSAANLTAPLEYDFDTYIRRGQNGTTISAHATGDPFMRIDEAVGIFDVPGSLLGTTVYIKLASYNKTGGSLQDLSDVTAYTFNIPYPTAATANGTVGGNVSSGGAATLQMTLDEGVLALTKIGASYYGVGVEGPYSMTNPRVLYKQSTSTGHLESTSFALGEWVTALATDGTSIVAATYNTTAGSYSQSRLVKVNPSNMTAPTANYTHNSPLSQGIFWGLAWDGSKYWAAETVTGNLVRLDANLTAEANYSLSGLANATSAPLTYANGALYIALNLAPATPALVKWDTTAHTVTWNVPTVHDPADVLVTGNLAVVSGSSELATYRTSNGAAVGANVTTGWAQRMQGSSLAVLGNYIVSVNPTACKPIEIDNTSGNLVAYLDVAATSLAGVDGNFLFVNYSPTGNYQQYLGYGYTTASVSSVGLNLPTELFVSSNTPITTTGNLSANLATHNAGLFFATPATGNACVPSFRAIVGSDLPRLTINTQTSNYTLALADANVAYIRMNSANALVVTVPSQANVAFSNGTNVLLHRAGAGNVSITSQANVTVNNASSNTLRAQHSTGALVYVGADVWDLFGDVT